MSKIYMDFELQNQDLALQKFFNKFKYILQASSNYLVYGKIHGFAIKSIFPYSKPLVNFFTPKINGGVSHATWRARRVPFRM